MRTVQNSEGSAGQCRTVQDSMGYVRQLGQCRAVRGYEDGTGHGMGYVRQRRTVQGAAWLCWTVQDSMGYVRQCRTVLKM
jgi:hypothetical protein